MPDKLVRSFDQIFANAFKFIDGLEDDAEFRDEALHLTSAGRVYLPFRNGEGLAFAPAKFIGYRKNNFRTYREKANRRNGGKARKAVSRVFGFDAEKNKTLEKQLENYCETLGIPLHKNKHSFWMTKEAKRAVKRDRSAIADLADGSYGNDHPEYLKRMAGSYVRNNKVRNKVLQRASGKCEYCEEVGFTDTKGNLFLEAHHIILLSEQGADKLSNVIALCPNHHREAHFGERWQELQDEFKAIVAKHSQ